MGEITGEREEGGGDAFDIQHGRGKKPSVIK